MSDIAFSVSTELVVDLWIFRLYRMRIDRQPRGYFLVTPWFVRFL